MRVFVFLALLTTSAVCVANNLYAQSTLITLKAENKSVKEIFGEIERNSEFIFFYPEGVLDANRKVSIDVSEQTISETLDIIFEGTDNAYRISDRQIFISYSPKPQTVAQAPPVASERITGRVTDAKGAPLTGVSVVANDGSAGTITDQNGNFSISITGPKTLLFSYIGFLKQEIVVHSSTHLNVTLKEDDEQQIDNVVVVGYGTLSRSNVSSAIGTYKPSELNMRSAISADQLLQGRISGVTITSSSGMPGANSRVSIRGIGSLSASNEPLYVIDGVLLNNSDADLGNFGETMSAMANLNPNDIESIEVLKDAASAAIYGSRATNGVIIITTKSGKKGAPVVTANISGGITQMVRKNAIEMAGSELYLEVMNEARDNYNLQTGSNIARLDNPYPGMPDTDWLDLILQVGKNYNATLSVSGGGENSSYYISANAAQNEGFFLGNRLDKYNVKTNLRADAKKWLAIGSNVNLSYSRNHRVPSGYSLGTNMLPRVTEQRPFDRPYNPDGSYTTNGSQLLNHNPLQALNEENVWLDNYKVLGNIYMQVNFTDRLNVRTSFGGDVGYTEDHIYYKKNHNYGNKIGRLTDGRRLQTNALMENTISYNNTFGSLFLDVVGGHSYQKVQTSLSSIIGLGFPSDSFDVIAAAAEIEKATTNLYATAIQSFFGRASLSWDKRYLLTVSMRADGSSRFHPDNRYGYFPSVSTGWNLSQEDFWTFPKTDVKLRASYGATGNQDGIGAFAYQALTGGGYNYNNKNGISITSDGNKDLKWEKANQFDAGIDLSLFRGAFSMEVDYFIKNTTNLLYNRPIHSTTGFTTISSNIGSMLNKGLEISLHGNVLSKGGFNWRSDFNIAFIKNKLTSLIDDDPIVIGTLGVNVLKVGEEVGSFYMVKQTGIYQYDSEVPQVLYDQGVRAGDCIYEDVTGEGNITSDDRQVVGSANPKFSGGFNNTFTYKGFDFSVFFTYSYGNMVYEGWTGGYRLGNGNWPVLKKIAEERWTGPGTSDTVPRAIYGLTYNSTARPNTRFLHDASYIRCRNVTLGYTLPQRVSNALRLKSARIYAQVDNLFLLTRFPLLDPEVNISLSASAMGQDFLLPPQPRIINMGINVTF